MMRAAIVNTLVAITFMGLFTGCAREDSSDAVDAIENYTLRLDAMSESQRNGYGKGALLLTRFGSLQELESIIDIKHLHLQDGGEPASGIPEVRLIHHSNGKTVVCYLRQGISEEDFVKAKYGNLWDRVRVGLSSPYALLNRWNLLRVELLSRNRPMLFGEGDVAFYHLAEAMVGNISDSDRRLMSERDLSEKGYLNTFNHITAQAMMTSLFTEKMAHFVAAIHERYTIPELISGNLTEEQINDIDFGAVDNYVDIINNEWGQALGYEICNSLDLAPDVRWTPELLAAYLNNVQMYLGWAFNIGFEPFTAEEEIIRKFSRKLNLVLFDLPDVSRSYL